MLDKEILVVDDDQDLRTMIRSVFESAGYTQVTAAASGEEALALMSKKIPGIIILDVMMPGMDGWELCRRIRQDHTFPIIMLTARDEETDKITGLTLGADDYVTKPFRPLELMARVKAQLRRYTRYNTDGAAAENRIAYRGLELNIDTHDCIVNGDSVTLTPTEFDILRYLLEHKGRAVSSENLFHGVWKDDYYVKSSSSITVHIRHLREKLGDNVEKPKYIKTIWGVGYKIENE